MFLSSKKRGPVERKIIFVIKKGNRRGQNDYVVTKMRVREEKIKKTN